MIPVEINQRELNFILDTGVNKTIVFNASKQDSTVLRNQRKIKLQGLGNGDPVEAAISSNNRFRIGNMISNNQKVYIVLEDEFDLSSKMGITIHGVIGYDLLKDVVALIQYNKKTIRFFNPKNFRYKKCKRCVEFPLTLFQNKPYIDVKVGLNDSIPSVPVRMLIDSGGSDALWLFEYSKDEIVTPKNYFNDILGVGLSGTIYGKRSRISNVSIGNFTIKRPTISFLDTVSTENARKYKLRNGSIGSNILKRFRVLLDYRNKRMVLKRTGSLSGGFEYNMSGLEVVYNGKIIVREESKTISRDNYGRNISNTSKNSLSIVTSYNYKFKPSYKVNSILKGSPAHIAGVLPGDILIKINGVDTHQMSLGEILGKFRSKDNKRINLTVQRDGLTRRFQFRLKRRL